MIYNIWEKLKPHTMENNIKVSLFIAKCNKHTISNLLNLKLIGINEIFLSKCSPIMLNPTLTKTLQTIYGINPTTTPNEDIKKVYDL